MKREFYSNLEVTKRRKEGYWRDGEYTPPFRTKKEKEEMRQQDAAIQGVETSSFVSNSGVKIDRMEFDVNDNHVVTLTRPNGKTTILLNDDKIATVESFRAAYRWLSENL